MELRTALVTLVIGDEFRLRWKAVSEKGWLAYCSRHGFDLVVIGEALDASPRAQARSPAWQKLLTLNPTVAGKYERVIWVDADIIINPSAPPITQDVPLEKLGAVDEHSFPTPESRKRIIRSLIEYWRPIDAKIAGEWECFLAPAAWHARAELPKRGQHILQSGVMVLSPRHHRELFEHIYNGYEQIGGYEMNFEMRPLSYEAQERGMVHWIDGRFNALLAFLKMEYEFQTRSLVASARDMRAFLSDAYGRNYFLHFAGVQPWMRILGATRLTDAR
jgi:hypothetical protein